MNDVAVRLHDDPGLQPERTTLAWTRTIVALILVSMIWLRWSHAYGGTVLVMVFCMVAAAAILHLTQRHRYRRMADGLADDRVHADICGVFALTTCLCAFGVGGLVLILA